MRKGFTLIELLVVIGILAVLATATALIINPAELLKQGRDSTRVADLAAVSGPIQLYVTDQTGVAGFSIGACATGIGTKGRTTAAVTTGSFASVGADFATGTRAIGSTGWVDALLGSISGGAPFGALPQDPTNTGDLVYRYACETTNSRYELNAGFESAKYLTTLDLDANVKDGGSNDAFYEVGNILDL